MKSIFKILLVLSAFILVILLLPDRRSEPRTGTKINLNWKFILDDDSSFCKPDFDDSDWEFVTLPHDWMIEGEVNEENSSNSAGGFYSEDIGWYRKQLDLSEYLAKDQFYLLFDGVYMNADVWINGTWLGNHKNGYAGFHYDISDYVRKDTVNIIAVRTDCSLLPAEERHSGAGIYRNVKLIATEKVHFAVQHSAITTTDRYSERIATSITTIQNNTNKAGRYKIRSKLYSPDGELVERYAVSKSIDGNRSTEILQEITIPDPEFWSDKNPALYKLKTELVRYGHVVDNIQTAFAVRDVHFSSDSGFILNGRKALLKGVSIHYDGGALGLAVPEITWEYRLKALKELGVNALRLADNLHTPEFMEMCDRMGFFVIEEMYNQQEINPVRFNDISLLLKTNAEIKPSAYYTQSIYSDKPMVKIVVAEKELSGSLYSDNNSNNSNNDNLQLPYSAASVVRHWNFENGKKLTILVYTNCEEVELTLNGQGIDKIRKRDFDNGVIKRMVDYNKGMIHATAKYIDSQGVEQIVKDSLVTANKGTRIILEPDKTELIADGSDAVHIKTSVTDSAGVIDPTSNHIINYEVEGRGQLKVIDNGDPTDHSPYKSQRKRVHQGTHLVIIQSTSEPGDLTISASAQGLAPAQVKFKSIPPKNIINLTE